ncbi:hypothetical protein ACFQZC_25990 [Streptacidiphilus monticola]
MGDWTVQVALASGGRTVTQDVTVHVHPATTGPDLARTATATSSGDETPDFPASAVNDGDPTTRWSSPPRTTPGCSSNWRHLPCWARSFCTGRTRTPRSSRCRPRWTASTGPPRRW